MILSEPLGDDLLNGSISSSYGETDIEIINNFSKHLKSKRYSRVDLKQLRKMATDVADNGELFYAVCFKKLITRWQEMYADDSITMGQFDAIIKRHFKDDS